MTSIYLNKTLVFAYKVHEKILWLIYLTLLYFVFENFFLFSGKTTMKNAGHKKSR